MSTWEVRVGSLQDWTTNDSNGGKVVVHPSGTKLAEIELAPTPPSTMRWAFQMVMGGFAGVSGNQLVITHPRPADIQYPYDLNDVVLESITLEPLPEVTLHSVASGVLSGLFDVVQVA